MMIVIRKESSVVQVPPWEVIGSKIKAEIDTTFYDAQFVWMDPDSGIDTACTRKGQAFPLAPSISPYYNTIRVIRLTWMAYRLLLCVYGPGCWSCSARPTGREIAYKKIRKMESMGRQKEQIYCGSSAGVR